MKRKALVGVLVICLLMGVTTISGSVETSDSIKVPDELPNGQKLVKTNSPDDEESRRSLSRDLPHYLSGTMYMFSRSPTSESSTEQTSIGVVTFKSEKDARDDLQNFVSNDLNVVLVSELRGMGIAGMSESEIREELEKVNSYLECDIPDLYVIGEFDGVLFPLGKNIVVYINRR